MVGVGMYQGLVDGNEVRYRYRYRLITSSDRQP
jgi:hypothetical protein